MASGELRQTSNINGEGSSTYVKRGTYAVAGEAGWSNYTVAARLKTAIERNGATLTFETVADNLYFNGRLIRTGREVVAVDRLASVRWRRNLETGATATFDYWAYGQEKPAATGQEREKFRTYYRDATGLDYADQRYYASQWGRFLTADRFVSATAVGSPTRGWNRYAYVGSDPINFADPSGLDECSVEYGMPCFSMTTFLGLLPRWGGGIMGGASYTGPNLEVPPEFQVGLQGDLATAGPVRLSVRRLSKAGRNQTLMENTLRWIRSALDDDPDCARWLAGAQSYIENLLSESLIAHGEFENEPTIAAFTGTAGTNVPAGYAAMVINVEGAFFRSGFTVAGGEIQGGTDLARVFVLLHELGHGLEIKDFEPDFRDPEAGARNDARVLENCKKTLDKLR